MDWVGNAFGPEASALGAGAVYGLGSALSVGPNNIMLLRAGLAGGRVGATLGAVLLSYFSLLAVAGLTADWLVTVGAPLRVTASWAGLAALLWFAGRSFFSAARGGVPGLNQGAPRETLRACFVRVLTVVWCNPLTPIELLLLPAVLCETLPSQGARTAFVIGLALGEMGSCCAYCLGGRLMAPLVRQRWAMQLVDLVSGVVMARAASVVASQLVLGWRSAA